MMMNLNQIQAVLFDMDGVLYRGDRALAGVNEMIGFLERNAIRYACITNNASRTPQQVAEGTQRMGIHLSPDHILTSAMATNVYLRTVAPRGTTIYVVGMEGLTSQLFGDGYFVPDDRTPQYVVAGIDFDLTYAKLRTACLAIRAGATFIGTNPDTTFPAADGIVPGAGSILAALAAATGREPMIIGKPARSMFDTALMLLDAHAETTLVVGDRYDTDILGGADAGLRTAMVLTGVSDRAEAEAGRVPPDLVVDDLPALQRLWQAALDDRR
jgi:4-nitrophenyl phosphatase